MRFLACSFWPVFSPFIDSVFWRKQVSFIPKGRYCDSASDNPQTRPQDSPKGGPGVSGHMKVDPLAGTLPLGATDAYIIGSSPGIFAAPIFGQQACSCTGTVRAQAPACAPAVIFFQV